MLFERSIALRENEKLQKSIEQHLEKKKETEIWFQSQINKYADKVAELLLVIDDNKKHVERLEAEFNEVKVQKTKNE